MPRFKYIPKQVKDGLYSVINANDNITISENITIKNGLVTFSNKRLKDLSLLELPEFYTHINSNEDGKDLNEYSFDIEEKIEAVKTMESKTLTQYNFYDNYNHKVIVSHNKNDGTIEIGIDKNDQRIYFSHRGSCKEVKIDEDCKLLNIMKFKISDLSCVKENLELFNDKGDLPEDENTYSTIRKFQNNKYTDYNNAEITFQQSSVYGNIWFGIENNRLLSNSNENTISEYLSIKFNYPESEFTHVHSTDRLSVSRNLSKTLIDLIDEIIKIQGFIDFNSAYEETFDKVYPSKKQKNDTIQK